MASSVIEDSENVEQGLGGHHVLVDMCDSDPLTSPLKHSSRIKYTSVAVGKKYIALGANTGAVYMFDRTGQQHLQVVDSNQPRTEVTKVAFSPDENILCVVSSSGMVSVIEHHTDCHKKSEVMRVSSLHKGCQVTSLVGKETRFFLGDVSGKVSAVSTSREFFKLPSEVMMKLDSAIVQLDVHGDLILVSTETRSYLGNTTKQQFTQVGKKLRDLPVGGCFFQPRNLSTPLVYCARPGSRLWEVDQSGNVLNTHQFKQLLDVPPLQPISMESQDHEFCGDNPGPQSVGFTTLHTLGGQYLLSICDKGLYILHTSKVMVLQWSDNIKSTDLMDYATYKSELYLLYPNNRVCHMTLMAVPKLVKTLFERENIRLCAQMALAFSETLLEEKMSKKYNINAIMGVTLREHLKRQGHADLAGRLNPLIDKLDNTGLVEWMAKELTVTNNNATDGAKSHDPDGNSNCSTAFNRTDSGIFVMRNRTASFGSSGSFSEADMDDLLERLQNVPLAESQPRPGAEDAGKNWKLKEKAQSTLFGIKNKLKQKLLRKESETNDKNETTKKENETNDKSETAKKESKTDEKLDKKDAQDIDQGSKESEKPSEQHVVNYIKNNNNEKTDGVQLLTEGADSDLCVRHSTKSTESNASLESVKNKETSAFHNNTSDAALAEVSEKPSENQLPNSIDVHNRLPQQPVTHNLEDSQKKKLPQKDSHDSLASLHSQTSQSHHSGDQSPSGEENTGLPPTAPEPYYQKTYESKPRTGRKKRASVVSFDEQSGKGEGNLPVVKPRKEACKKKKRSSVSKREDTGGSNEDGSSVDSRGVTSEPIDPCNNLPITLVNKEDNNLEDQESVGDLTLEKHSSIGPESSLKETDVISAQLSTETGQEVPGCLKSRVVPEQQEVGNPMHNATEPQVETEEFFGVSLEDNSVSLKDNSLQTSQLREIIETTSPTPCGHQSTGSECDSDSLGGLVVIPEDKTENSHLGDDDQRSSHVIACDSNLKDIPSIEDIPSLNDVPSGGDVPSSVKDVSSNEGDFGCLLTKDVPSQLESIEQQSEGLAAESRDTLVTIVNSGNHDNSIHEDSKTVDVIQVDNTVTGTLSLGLSLFQNNVGKERVLSDLAKDKEDICKDGDRIDKKKDIVPNLAESSGGGSESQSSQTKAPEDSLEEGREGEDVVPSGLDSTVDGLVDGEGRSLEEARGQGRASLGRKALDSVTTVRDRLSTKARSFVRTLKDTKDWVTAPKELQPPLDVAPKLQADVETEDDPLDTTDKDDVTARECDYADDTTIQLDTDGLEEATRLAIEQLNQGKDSETVLKDWVIHLNRSIGVLKTLLIGRTLNGRCTTCHRVCNEASVPECTTVEKETNSDSPNINQDQKPDTSSNNLEEGVGESEVTKCRVVNTTCETCDCYFNDTESKALAESINGSNFKEMCLLSDPFELNDDKTSTALSYLATACFERGLYGDNVSVLKVAKSPPDLEGQESVTLDSLEFEEEDEIVVFMKCYLFCLDLRRVHRHVVTMGDHLRRKNVWKALSRCLQVLSYEEAEFSDHLICHNMSEVGTALTTLNRPECMLGCILRLCSDNLSIGLEQLSVAITTGQLTLVDLLYIFEGRSLDIQIPPESPAPVKDIERRGSGGDRDMSREKGQGVVEQTADQGGSEGCESLYKLLKSFVLGQLGKEQEDMDRLRTLDVFCQDTEVYLAVLCSLLDQGKPSGDTVDCTCGRLPRPQAHRLPWLHSQVIYDLLRLHTELDAKKSEMCSLYGFWAGLLFIQALNPHTSASGLRSQALAVAMQLGDPQVLVSKQFGILPLSEQEAVEILRMKYKQQHKSSTRISKASKAAAEANDKENQLEYSGKKLLTKPDQTSLDWIDAEGEMDDCPVFILTDIKTDSCDIHQSDQLVSETQEKRHNSVSEYEIFCLHCQQPVSPSKQEIKDDFINRLSGAGHHSQLELGQSQSHKASHMTLLRVQGQPLHSSSSSADSSHGDNWLSLFDDDGDRKVNMKNQPLENNPVQNGLRKSKQEVTSSQEVKITWEVLVDILVQQFGMKKTFAMLESVDLPLGALSTSFFLACLVEETTVFQHGKFHQAELADIETILWGNKDPKLTVSST